jgi:hypothetical protein
MTPPGGNNGNPAAYVCMNGASAATPTSCGAGTGGLWTPDLVKQERRWIFSLMVKL